MVSIPFYLVLLVELVLLESLAIAGFFVFRWWRERQDQTVLEALVTATETSALARNQVLRTKVAELIPDAAELAEKAEQLLDTEVRFQKRLIAAFRHRRLLSLGRLPVWTEELLVPYQALMDGIQGALATQALERQKEMESEVERLNTELAHAREEIQQTRQEAESVGVELSSTQDALAEKAARVESLEREYESAFHHNFTGEQAPEGPVAAPPTEGSGEAGITTPPADKPESAPETTTHDNAVVSEEEPERASDAGSDLTIDECDDEAEGVIDQSAPAPQEDDPDLIEAAVQQRSRDDKAGQPTTEPENTAPAPGAASDPDMDWEAAFAAQAAARDNQAPAKDTSGEQTASGTTASRNEIEDPEPDWGVALAEQAATETTAGEADDLDWDAALAQQAASETDGEAEETPESAPSVDGPADELTIADDEIDEDIDLDWSAALAEQVASAAAGNSNGQATKTAG